MKAYDRRTRSKAAIGNEQRGRTLHQRHLLEAAVRDGIREAIARTRSQIIAELTDTEQCVGFRSVS